MNETKEEKTRHLFWPALLLLLLLLAPVHMVRVQAASDQSTVELKLSQGIRRYDYAYQVLDLVIVISLILTADERTGILSLWIRTFWNAP